MALFHERNVQAAKKLLGGEKYAERVARKLIPVLIGQALGSQTSAEMRLSYSDVVERIGHSFLGDASQNAQRNLRHALDRIGRALVKLSEGADPIPPLTVLVVKKGSPVPGAGVATFFSMTKEEFIGLPKDKQELLIELQFERIREYGHWAEVETALLGETGNPKNTRQIHEGRSGPEGQEHLALKDLVMRRPEDFGLPSWANTGRSEENLLSGDVVNVIFDLPEGCIAIDVKPSSASLSDMLRGIFQCAKYKTILELQKGYSQKKVYVSTVLVLGGRLDPKLRPIWSAVGCRLFEGVTPSHVGHFQETPLA